jgi:hypothetical protein
MFLRREKTTGLSENPIRICKHSGGKGPRCRDEGVGVIREAGGVGKLQGLARNRQSLFWLSEYTV